MQINIIFIYVFYLLILLGCQRSITDQNQIPKEAICPTIEPQPPTFEDIEQDTGYVQVERGGLFYWFIQTKNHPDTAPVVLRLTGGPGISGMGMAFSYSGPLGFNNDFTVYRRNASWNDKAHMIYVDHPVGVGYSYFIIMNGDKVAVQSYAKNEQEVTEDLLAVLIELFEKKHPELKGRELFIDGVSYAGIYIPWLAKAIVQYNLKQGRTVFNLKGIAIHDGELDRLASYKSVPQFALEKGIIDEKEYETLVTDYLPPCEAKIKEIRDKR